jgi:hypothetical protein
MVSRWRTNSERARARSWRPIPVQRPPSSPPTMTSVPAGVSARRSRDSGELPPRSSRADPWPVRMKPPIWSSRPVIDSLLDRMQIR